MKKDDLIILIPTLLLVGAFIGSQLDDMFEQNPQTAPKQPSEWPLIKILLYGGAGLFILNEGRKLIQHG